jgi:hypothetical protein
MPGRCFAIALLTTALTACSSDASIPTNEVTRLSVFTSGDCVFSRELDPNDPLLVLVKNWIDQQHGSWGYGQVTDDAAISLEGKTYTIAVSPESVSLKRCQKDYDCDYYITSSNALFTELVKRGYTRKAQPEGADR